MKVTEIEVDDIYGRPSPGRGCRRLHRTAPALARLPIVLHHFPTSAAYEILRKPADAYMRLNQYG